MSRQQAQAAMQRAQAGDQRIEQINSELTFAMSQLDELKAGLTSAGQAAIIARREAESAKQRRGRGQREEQRARLRGVPRDHRHGRPQRRRLGGGGGGSVQRRAELGKLRAQRESSIREIPTRERRHGFDDAPAPMAVLTLEGKFRELNAAFSKLVGYQEHEFLKAVWPSVHDRAVYKQQTEELALLKTGEIESVKFQSSYMHSQGLMVPVDGELTLVRDEAGEPASLLLTAAER